MPPLIHPRPLLVLWGGSCMCTGRVTHEVSMDGYPRFTSECSSLLKKHLSPDVYLACAGRVTPNGFTFDQVCQSGVDNQDSGVGLYAGDEEAYTVFAPIFDLIIEDYHGGYKPTDRHVSDMDFTKLKGTIDPEGKYVLSTRIRVGRNIRGLGLSPGCTRAQRREVERIVTTALSIQPAVLRGGNLCIRSPEKCQRVKAIVAYLIQIRQKQHHLSLVKKQVVNALILQHLNPFH